MEPLTTHRGKVAVLNWADVDTDRIIPARYLKRIERIGYGPLLFADTRYAPGAAPDADAPERGGPLRADFPLNDPKYRDATVLAVGRNFGCGSSREHAVWAVQQAGYRVVVAPGAGEGFADIFESNAYNNGLLPIELEPEAMAEIIAEDARNGAEVTIDLPNQAVVLHRADGTDEQFAFAVPSKQKQMLIEGRDAIGLTLQHESAITQHETCRPAWTAVAESAVGQA